MRSAIDGAGGSAGVPPVAPAPRLHVATVVFAGDRLHRLHADVLHRGIAIVERDDRATFASSVLNFPSASAGSKSDVGVFVVAERACQARHTGSLAAARTAARNSLEDRELSHEPGLPFSPGTRRLPCLQRDFPEVRLAPYRTQLHYRWALPWVCLLVVFIAAPLGIVYNRRGILGEFVPWRSGCFFPSSSLVASSLRSEKEIASRHGWRRGHRWRFFPHRSGSPFVQVDQPRASQAETSLDKLEWKASGKSNPVRDFVREQANRSKRVNASTRCSSVMGMAFGERISAKRAWRERNENIQPFSFWRSKYKAPQPPPSEPLRKEDAENLLRRLVSEAEPATVNARYILALILERKRILRPIESSDESLLVYEHAGTGGVDGRAESSTFVRPTFRCPE